jgi:hypothetical protein
MTARTHQNNAGCKNFYEWAEKSIGSVSRSVVRFVAFGGLNQFLPMASFMPSRTAALMTRYATQSEIAAPKSASERSKRNPAAIDSSICYLNGLYSMTLQIGPCQRNAHQWRQVADFLDVQWLASLGLRRLSLAESEARRQGPACGMAPQREALPVGNTGITSLLELASV